VFGNRVLGRIFGPKREAGEDCIMRSFITCTLHQYYEGDQVKENMGITCSTHGKVRNAYEFW
jgi:hypothetical protein